MRADGEDDSHYGLNAPVHLVRLTGLQAELESTRKQLEHQDRHCREMSSMLNIGVWEWDEIEDRPIYNSEEMAEIFGTDGVDSAELYDSKEGFLNYIHPEDSQRYREYIEDKTVFSHGKSHHVIEYRIIDGRGAVRHLREVA